AAAPVQLELAFAFAKRYTFAFVHNGNVGIEEAVANGLHEAERTLEAAGAEVVEEQPADAARFASVLEKEVLVAPALVFCVDVIAKRRAQIARDGVPVH